MTAENVTRRLRERAKSSKEGGWDGDAALDEEAARTIEQLQKRLGGIHSLACYASEEDTDSQPTMLLKIGRVARGEEEVTWPII